MNVTHIAGGGGRRSGGVTQVNHHKIKTQVNTQITQITQITQMTQITKKNSNKNSCKLSKNKKT